MKTWIKVDVLLTTLAVILAFSGRESYGQFGGQIGKRLEKSSEKSATDQQRLPPRVPIPQGRPDLDNGSQLSSEIAHKSVVVRDGQSVTKMRPYKTWSLFLINNPSWIVPQSVENVKALYDRFQAFGKVIGPDNLAVWFGSDNSAVKPLFSKKPTAEVFMPPDIARSVAFCGKAWFTPEQRTIYLDNNGVSRSWFAE